MRIRSVPAKCSEINAIGEKIMKQHRKCKAILSTALAGSLLFSALTMTPMQTADAASACTVNTNKTYQLIKGFGGINLPEWQAINLPQGKSADMTAKQVQKAFGNGDDELGLSILRIYISDDSNSWKTAVPTAKAAQELGATVFASPWYPPASIRKNGPGGNTGKYALDSSQFGNYAKHLNSYIKYMEGEGIDLYSVSVQNEPDYAKDWTYWSTNDLVSFIANYGKQVTEGTNAKLMSPESFQYRKEFYNGILNNAKAFENCDLFGTHFYGTSRNDMDFPALENCGKDIWMTEVYVPDSSINGDAYPASLDQAVNIHNGMVVGNMNAYVVWFIRRSYGPMKEDDNISKRGYCLAQYSKWIRPGDIRIDATEQPNSNILVSAYKHSPTQVTVVAVNNGNSDVSQEFNISGRSITNVDRYRTSANENIAKTKGMEYSGSGFYAQLPAKSVSTFVVTMESDGIEVPQDPNGPREPLQPDENGVYFHDTFETGTDDWNGRGGASVQPSAAQASDGSKSLLVQDRTKAWNGAEKTLDYTTFKAGDTFSFGAKVFCGEAEADQELMLSLQYKNAAGDTEYAHIASADAVSGQFVTLQNTDFKLPEGASNMILYIETNAGTQDLYLDDVFVGVAGTDFFHDEPLVFTPGDVNNDGKVNAVDLTLAKRFLAAGQYPDRIAKSAADADQNGTADAADTELIRDFILGKIRSFSAA